MAGRNQQGVERRRLEEDARRKKNWKRWGPYLSERQWGTVREDYSPDGDCWNYLGHDQARSTAYRWGEDGLLGITDRECRLCFALALWNGRDPILKERLFGLTPTTGNHGEDVKEYYFYLDSTPTHSYMKALYKYPQGEFPYRRLIETNSGRDKQQGEFELLDTGVFADSRYFDVFAEYAKAGPDDILIRLSVVNRGPEKAALDLLAMLWCRNTWSFGSPNEPWDRPTIQPWGQAGLKVDHSSLGAFRLAIGPGPDGRLPELLFTENETDFQGLHGTPNIGPYVKDAFHRYVVDGDGRTVNPDRHGTRAAGRYRLEIDPGQTISLRLRLFAEDQAPADPLGPAFPRTFRQRQQEADEFYGQVIPATVAAPARNVIRQAYAGLLWSRQFYYYVVRDWLEGDPKMPPPPPQRKTGRNSGWTHMFNRNVLSVPDKWEFPWYASWDLDFQMLPLGRLDPDFAKEQLSLLLREWFMHPSGQLPAFEFSFADANPPVHAWSCLRVYQAADSRPQRDRAFLESCFQKLLLDFTWWVNRKDIQGRGIFSGGFLGMDNIGVIDRNNLPEGMRLEQADGTAWMAFYCLNMLTMAMELAEENPVYEDIASKFFNHFVAISEAINTLGGTGLWDEQDGFYYDVARVREEPVQLRVRSLSGLIPLIAVAVLDADRLEKFPGFRSRMNWFLEHRVGLGRQISYMERSKKHPHRLLAIPSPQRLERVLRYMLDESEFLSPYGIRSLSKHYQDHPFTMDVMGHKYRIDYEPGESTTTCFGGNSNWRGPVWLPVNYLFIEALRTYHDFFGEAFEVECPTGSGNRMNLLEVSREIQSRLCRIFLPDDAGRCPWQGEMNVFADDPNWREGVLFHEYFHGETGRGCGASHQTGWTSLIALLLADHGPAQTPGRQRRTMRTPGTTR